LDLKLLSAYFAVLTIYADAAIVLEVAMTLPLPVLMSYLRRRYKR